MAADTTWAIYSDESSYNYGVVRGVGALCLQLDDSARLGEAVADLLGAAGVRELKWEKVRTARTAFVAEKALTWALDHVLDGELWIETLTWDVTTTEASHARKPALNQLREAYRALLASVIARRAGRNDLQATWRIIPDEQTAIPWARLPTTFPPETEITPACSETQPLIQVADLFAGLAVFSRAAYDAYERWLCLPSRDRTAGVNATARHAPASQAYRFALLDDFYATCVRRLPGISLQTRRGLYTWRADAPMQFRFLTQATERG